MPHIKKIQVNKNDEIAKVIEELIDADAEEVILSIPKFSRLIGSATNFHLLKREAEALNKKIVVESVDDMVLTLCEKENLECVNPFFGKPSERGADARFHGNGKGHRVEKFSENAAEERTVAQPEVQAGESLILPKKIISASIFRRGYFKLPKKKGRVVAGVFVVLVLGGFLVGNAFQKAEIQITRETNDWKFEDPIVVDKTISQIDAGGVRVPGQIFSQVKNFAMSFPASGSGSISRKAKGTISVYNAFNTSPQALVVRTRFLTPDGKLYRLTKGITVPAAKKENGKIVSASIEAEVEADEAGEEYNIGPVEKFTIPGFKGTPRYEGFYADSKEAMRGGFIGETAYPTDEDIEKAKEFAAKTLENTIANLVIGQLAKGFVVLDDAKTFAIKKQTVDEEVGDDNQFSVFTEGEFSLVAFREDDVRELLIRQMREKVGQDYEIKSDKLTYKENQVSSQGDNFVITPEYESVVARSVDLLSLKKNIAGKSEEELRKFIFSIPGLVSARISLRPFWIRTVPNPGQIEVVIE